MMLLRLAAGFLLGGELPFVFVDHDDDDHDEDDDDAVEAGGGVPLGR